MTPWFDDYQKIFFDEKYMVKCAGATSSAMLETCAGKGYYKFVKEFFDDHYFVFDNGFEGGIRSGCETKNGSICDFHCEFKGVVEWVEWDGSWTYSATSPRLFL